MKLLMTIMTGVGFKTLLLLFITIFLVIQSPQTVAQNSCDAYFDVLEDQVYRMFTSDRSANYRAAAFPQDLQNVSESEISRLNLPEEQHICDQLLSTIDTSTEPGEPERHRAAWKVNNYYLLVTYSYYTDNLGNQLPHGTGGILYNSEFEHVQLIPRI
jgi:hypothetical protein